MVNIAKVLALTESYDNYDYSYNRSVTDVDACKEALDEAIIEFYEFQSNASSIMVESAMKGINNLELLQESIWEGIKEKGKKIISAIIQAIINLKNWFMTIIGNLKKKVSQFLKWVKSGFTSRGESSDKSLSDPNSSISSYDQSYNNNNNKSSNSPQSPKEHIQNEPLSTHKSNSRQMSSDYGKQEFQYKQGPIIIKNEKEILAKHEEIKQANRDEELRRIKRQQEREQKDKEWEYEQRRREDERRKQLEQIEARRKADQDARSRATDKRSEELKRQRDLENITYTGPIWTLRGLTKLVSITDEIADRMHNADIIADILLNGPDTRQIDNNTKQLVESIVIKHIFGSSSNRVSINTIDEYVMRIADVNLASSEKYIITKNIVDSYTKILEYVNNIKANSISDKMLNNVISMCKDAERKYVENPQLKNEQVCVLALRTEQMALNTYIKTYTTILNKASTDCMNVIKIFAQYNK